MTAASVPSEPNLLYNSKGQRFSLSPPMFLPAYLVCKSFLSGIGKETSPEQAFSSAFQCHLVRVSLTSSQEK